MGLNFISLQLLNNWCQYHKNGRQTQTTYLANSILCVLQLQKIRNILISKVKDRTLNQMKKKGKSSVTPSRPGITKESLPHQLHVCPLAVNELTEPKQFSNYGLPFLMWQRVATSCYLGKQSNAIKVGLSKTLKLFSYKYESLYSTHNMNV